MVEQPTAHHWAAKAAVAAAAAAESVQPTLRSSVAVAGADVEALGWAGAACCSASLSGMLLHVTGLRPHVWRLLLWVQVGSGGAAAGWVQHSQCR